MTGPASVPGPPRGERCRSRGTRDPRLRQFQQRLMTRPRAAKDCAIHTGEPWPESRCQSVRNYRGSSPLHRVSAHRRCPPLHSGRSVLARREPDCYPERQGLNRLPTPRPACQRHQGRSSGLVSIPHYPCRSKLAPVASPRHMTPGRVLHFGSGRLQRGYRRSHRCRAAMTSRRPPS